MESKYWGKKVVRSLFQIYVKDIEEAVKFYKNAFKEPLRINIKYPDGSYNSVELDLFGQILSISEGDNKKEGNVMQFCLNFSEDDNGLVTDIYNALKIDAKEIKNPLGICNYSPLMFSLIDKFGVNWWIFTIN